MKMVQGIWLPDNDTHFAKFLKPDSAINGKATYQYQKLLRAMRHCPGRELAIDVGAHVGLWSMHLARKFNRVIAFEPLPNVGHCWYRNVPDENATLLHMGLSDVKQSLSLMQDPKNSGVVTITEGGPTAKFAPLDDIATIDVSLDFIKIDVEGHEAHVIRGMTKHLTNHNPTICIEQKSNKDALPLLKDLGYNQIDEIEGDYILVKEKKNGS